MVVEIFEEDHWLSTTKPRQILNEKEIEFKHRAKGKTDSMKDLKKFYNSLGGPIVHKKKWFMIEFSGSKKVFKVFLRDGYERYLKDKFLLEEEVYMGLKKRYKDSFKMSFPEND